MPVSISREARRETQMTTMRHLTDLKQTLTDTTAGISISRHLYLDEPLAPPAQTAWEEVLNTIQDLVFYFLRTLSSTN